MGLIMPSTMARAGGVFLPVIKSLSLSAGSKPGDSSSRRLGAFLIQTQLQVKSSAGHSGFWFRSIRVIRFSAYLVEWLGPV